MAEASSADVPLLRTDLAHLLERITDGFFALDSAWRLVYINSEARNLLRAGNSDVVGKYWLDAFPRARGTAFEREYTRAMREQTPVQFTEFSSTSQRWLEVKAYPSTDGISVYFRDVTARMKAERELETRSAQLQAVIAFGRLALSGATIEQLWTDAMEMMQVYIDVPLVELHLYDPEAQVLRLAAADGWENAAQTRDLLQLDSQAGEALRKAQPIVASDVRIDPRFSDKRAFTELGVRAGMCVLMGTREDPLGVISAYTSSPRVFTTNDVRFVESIATIIGEATRTNEQKRRVIEVLESITDSFASLDPDLIVTYVNGRMAELYSMPREAIVGKHLRGFMPNGPGDENIKYYEEALLTGRAVTYESFVPSTNDWYEVRIYPSADGLSVYLRDVTARKLGEMRMLELNEELERRVVERTTQLELANKELESFAYSVSHDLRAPLRAIDGFSQALEEDYASLLDGQAMTHLSRVRSAAKRMGDLIDALLKLAHVARQPIVPAPVDLSAIAESFASDLRSIEPDRAVRFVIDPGLRAIGEPMLLRAVLENLMGNAWKFTRNKDEAVIEFGLQGEEFFVRDNGAGFDMAYANKLFGAFQRLHSADEYEGTGIGLATVARIVHRHGGEIRAKGTVGAGATFYFTLPPVEDAT
jgi:PAS domain S-box-containing protein